MSTSLLVEALIYFPLLGLYAVFSSVLVLYGASLTKSDAMISL